MFTPPDYQQYTEVAGTYSLNVILLSFLILGFASYTTIALYDRMQQASFFRREVWLVLASLAFGFGIWATHFVSMNSLLFPIEMHVDYPISFLSMLPAIIASFLAFQLVQGPMKPCWRHAIGAALLAEGMTAMHVIGMESMKMDAIYRYDWKLMVAANIIGGLFAYFTLRLISNPNRSRANRGLAVIFLTIGPALMHYIGLFSMTYFVEIGQPLADEPISHMHFLNAVIGIGVGLLLVGMLLTTYIDGYVDHWLKYFDVLTKLPNRRNWERQLSDETAIGDLAIWNFPDLQRVNQLYGYEAGDKILQQIGELLAKWKPKFAQLYRVSGNRYLFYVTQAGRSADFYKSLVIIQREIDQLLPIKRQEMRYTCALSKADQRKTKKQLYKEALMVVEQASMTRNWGLITFDPAVYGTSYEQEVLRDISKAMDEKHLYLAYQPKIAGRTESFIGVEALLRWDHPEIGPISPAVFVPFLEQDGRMGEVTDWIIREVCRQIHRWDRQGVDVPQVAINIPGEYMTEPHLLDVLWKETNSYSIDPGRIELEITETSTAKSIALATAATKRFKRYGFAVALDDFGTGVSSLSYLQQLPITTLKIDKSFTDVVPASPKECAVLNAILAIGLSMELQIIIEGVETKEQVDFLLDLQPDLIFQGFYYARPMASEQLIEWIAEAQKSHGLVKIDKS
ncbi:MULTISPECIES: bifunctional diguanylate cyclase/phosphodiesterase [unclassified Sporosarcina]|uniref:sensor domain-containing diguanylate cyclase n=1 Tax=unclassified Sporosarcina TaxID=2647733 RepID=UPI00203DF1ED|nr:MULTISPECIES: EAL domain-containing protein [unclassified Sporosarcina]GKV65193.1 diguanylate cyclase [Sporosarcina sp. NCCP-2331]GLB55317.1 diguanylate cyclase [Sporosarcina sp. NCCP-2378]